MAETKTSPFRKLPPLTATGITYRLYESPTTGLRGMLMETAEPLCSLHVAIATESDTHDWTHKDDGLPHTLEHAIFMGSELYPFKGILDKLANRCLARGTNAWTATDHTCYTLDTAGQEGCLNMLPIYCDHIFNLQPSTFNLQPSTFNLQLSTFTSIFNFQFSQPSPQFSQPSQP